MASTTPAVSTTSVVTPRFIAHCDNPNCLKGYTVKTFGLLESRHISVKGVEFTTARCECGNGSVTVIQRGENLSQKEIDELKKQHDIETGNGHESHFANARAALPNQGPIGKSSNQQAKENFREAARGLAAARGEVVSSPERKSADAKVRDEVQDRMTRLGKSMEASWGQAKKVASVSTSTQSDRRAIESKLESAVHRIERMAGFDMDIASICFGEISEGLRMLLDRKHFSKDEFTQTVAEIRRALNDVERDALK